MKQLFTKYMFLVILIFYGVVYLFGGDSFGVNKTVGWAYDLSNQMFYNVILLVFSQRLFFIGYLIVAILRRKTNFKFSVVHAALILGTIILFSFKCYITSSICCLLSLVIFLKSIFNTYK